TLLPFVALDYWWVRIFDFPHSQLTVLTLVAFLVYFFRFDLRSWRDYVFACILAGCFVFQLGKIYPFTPFADFEVNRNEETDPRNSLGILAANVLQENRDTEKLMDVILTFDPDVIVLTETNTRWRNEVAPLIKQRYPFAVEVPLENTYGMLLYSRLRLIDPEVKFLIDDSIPSIHGILQMPSGKQVQFHSIYPILPMPQYNSSSSDRDVEMMMVAKMVREAILLVIVTVYFNFVSLSYTFFFFKKVFLFL